MQFGVDLITYGGGANFISIRSHELKEIKLSLERKHFTFTHKKYVSKQIKVQ